MEQEYFTKFVYGVYTELDEPENFSIAKISAWFLDNANVGKLNNLIGTQISGVAYKDTHGVVTGYDLSPNPSNDQLAIYKMMFDFEYFKKQITSQFPEVVEYPKNTFSLQDSINTLCVEDRIITISLKENFLTFNDLNTTLIMKNYYIEKIKLYKPS